MYSHYVTPLLLTYIHPEGPEISVQQSAAEPSAGRTSAEPLPLRPAGRRQSLLVNLVREGTSPLGAGGRSEHAGGGGGAEDYRRQTGDPEIPGPGERVLRGREF